MGAQESAPRINDLNAETVKSLTFRVTTANSCTNAFAVINPSATFSGLPFKLALACQNTPPFRNRFINSKDSVSEPGPQYSIEPLLKFSATFASVENSNAVQTLASEMTLRYNRSSSALSSQ